MRIAVVDDNENDRSELLQLLTQYSKNRRIRLTCEAFESAEAFFVAFEPGKYRMVFLDIYMNGMNGMDAARKIYSEDPHCRLIFCTTSHTHAVESYDVRAAYYLTKPVHYERLAGPMDICCAGFARENRYLTVHVRKIETQVLMRDLLYVDCVARKARLHLEEQVLVLDEQISEVLDMVGEDGRFLCCNRNVAVNMDCVQSAGADDFVLSTNEKIPIRQRGKNLVKKAFLAYALEDLRRDGP